MSLHLLAGRRSLKDDLGKAKKVAEKLEPRLRKVGWSALLLGITAGLALGVYMGTKRVEDARLMRLLRQEEDWADDESGNDDGEVSEV